MYAEIPPEPSHDDCFVMIFDAYNWESGMERGGVGSVRQSHEFD